MSLLLASLAASLLAQAPPTSALTTPTSGRVAVSVDVGGGSTWDDESRIGDGIAVGGSLTYRFHPRWAFAAGVERQGHDRTMPELRFTGHTTFVTGQLAYYFTSHGVSPYAGGGFGGAFYKGDLSSNRLDLSAIPRSSQSTAAYGLVGVEIPAGRRFVIAPDLRIYFLQPQEDFAPWSAVRLGVKAGIRF
jgi:outer membrane protein with beta-barrel domain